VSVRVESNIIQVPRFVISGGIQHLCHINMENFGHVPHFVIRVEPNIGHVPHFSPSFQPNNLLQYKRPNNPPILVRSSKTWQDLNPIQSQIVKTPRQPI
jgi:hypothetical protein